MQLSKKTMREQLFDFQPPLTRGMQRSLHNHIWYVIICFQPSLTRGMQLVSCRIPGLYEQTFNPHSRGECNLDLRIILPQFIYSFNPHSRGECNPIFCLIFFTPFTFNPHSRGECNTNCHYSIAYNWCLSTPTHAGNATAYILT